MSGYTVTTPTGRYAQTSTGEVLVFDTERNAETYIWDRYYDFREAFTIAPNTVENGRLVGATDLMRFSA